LAVYLSIGHLPNCFLPICFPHLFTYGLLVANGFIRRFSGFHAHCLDGAGSFQRPLKVNQQLYRLGRTG